jgi:aquaporin Z
MTFGAAHPTTTEDPFMTVKQYGAEFVGTFWLVFGGCGSAVLAAAFPDVGIGLLGVSLAFGLTVLTMAYAVGHISGGHFNPAVSIGLWAGGRFGAGQLLPYIVAQVLGAVAAGGVLYVVASGQVGFDVTAGFASNGFGEHSPGKYSMLAALVIEVVLTAGFLIVILGATDERAPKGFAPIAIALFAGGWAVSQLWLFWIAPIVGGVVGAWIYKAIRPNV